MMKDFDIRKYLGANKEYKIINEHCGFCPEDLQDEEPVVEDETLTEEATDDLKAVYDIAVELEKQVRHLKKEAGQQNVPANRQLRHFDNMAKIASNIILLSKPIIDIAKKHK